MRGEDFLQLAGNMELSQSNLPGCGEMVNLGTASTAKEVAERISTVRRAEEGVVKN